VYVREEAVIVREEAGEEDWSLFWQGILLDIMESKQVEEKLREANESLQELTVLKTDFTAMVAHELAHLLAEVGGFADLLSGDGLRPDERERALARIGSETEILKALVADVRAAARIERDDFDLWLRPVRVGTLLDAASTYAATLAGAHPLEVESSADVRVMADQYRVEQVLRNLVSNAAKYSPPGVPIKLRAYPAEGSGRIRVEVVDYSYGVHPDDVVRIFEKFGRGRNQEGQRVAGVGLGLYLSRRILRAYGSELALARSPVGSAFWLEVVG